MIIRLQPTQTRLHKPAAAFIRGSSPLVWLQEISRWKIAPHHLSCYILPQSAQAPSPAGLFVVIGHSAHVSEDLLLDPYGVVAGKLFLPVQASLFPECTTAELQKILMWEIQVFHPSIGWVGFDKNDAVSLVDLLQEQAPSSLSWNRANPGLSPRPPLQQIQVIQPTPDDMVAEMQKVLDTKPLDEMPGAKDGNITLLQKGWDTVQYGLFKTLFTIADWLQKGLQLVPSGNNSQGNSSDPGLLEKWMEWLSKNIAHLDKKRQDEIERLLSMFEDDSDEALQYAIPLNSPYLNRGKAAPTASLARRSLNFNLGNLGGGKAVDSWNIGDHYQTLRAKYIASAQKEIQKKDFKKAAYIYAHLLGDFHSAANVLVQGKHYREAAALYKTHLNNKQAAAECLENGGLTSEAIDLYIELDKTEKAGDLYLRLDKEEEANLYFEKTVSQYLTASNQSEAARVLYEKKKEADRAKKVLLNGWQQTTQPEKCLKQYFDIVAATEEERLKYQVERIYKDAPGNRQPMFLNVLHHIRQRYADEELKNRFSEIAYEIVSRKADDNDLSLLPQLKQFIAGDALLAPDISRYAHRRPRQTKKEENGSLQLDTSVKWQRATAYRNQIIAVGIKDKQLHIARFNWYKDVEYFSFPDEINNGVGQLISDSYATNTIIFTGWLGHQGWCERLPKNKYFTEDIIIDDIGLLPSKNAGITFNSEGDIIVLDGNGKSASLHYYTKDGKLLRSRDCQPINKNPLQFYSSSVAQPMQFNSNLYFAATNRFLAAIHPDGQYTYCETGSVIRLFAVSKLSPDIKVIASTNAGCILVRWHNPELQVQPHVFATDQIPSLVQFVSADRFVMTEKNLISVYEITGENLVVLIRKAEILSKVIAILSSSVRGMFAAVGEDGSVTLHDI